MAAPGVGLFGGTRALRAVVEAHRAKARQTDKEREILEAQLREIDLRRSQLEIVLGTLPPNTPQCCGDHRREELEAELRDLWSHRVEIYEQLNPPEPCSP